MVKQWGMSDKVGFRTHESESNSLVVVNDLSPQTAELIDTEIKTILEVRKAKQKRRQRQKKSLLLSSYCYVVYMESNGNIGKYLPKKDG